MFKPVQKEFLYMKAADIIHNYINDNQLQPGDKIPSERALAEQLQISRNSVREALRILSQEGILEVRTGIGTFVALPSTENSIYMQLFKGNYYEMLEIKTLLEKQAAMQGALLQTPSIMQNLEMYLLQIEEHAARQQYAGEIDIAFHSTILQFTQNKTLRRMVKDLIRILTEYGEQIPGSEPVFLTTIDIHREIWEAIKTGDVQRVSNAYDTLMITDHKVLEFPDK